MASSTTTYLIMHAYFKEHYKVEILNDFSCKVISSSQLRSFSFLNNLSNANLHTKLTLF